MAYNAINLKKGPVQYTEEVAAEAAITPGMLLAFDASGEVVKHAAASTNALPRFALEQAWRNDATDAPAIDVDYALADTVQTGVFGTGALVNAFLDSTSVDAEKGDALVSAGNGNLEVIGAITAGATNINAIVGYAYEAVTSPVSGNVRIQVEVR